MAEQIIILGSGCAKCERLFKLTRQAAAELKLTCLVEKETDIQQLLKYGVMMPPALIVDGQVKVSGKVPSLNDIKAMLT